MNYLSVCSGVEAATVAWHGLGWKPVGFSEIEKFPSAVLQHHYPQVTNYGDMTKYKEWNINDTVGLLVGGTPCQSFSVAGLRKGLEDPRGNLALTYVGILDRFKPKWFIWENVPGVLSSSGGRDFGSFLGAVAECGYGFAYRVLDAQYFGVPQRRRRVFVVGCLGDWESAAKVLFESSCLSGDHPKSREKRERVTSYLERGIAYGGTDGECADTVTSKWHKGSGGPSGSECGLFVAHKVYETHPAMNSGNTNSAGPKVLQAYSIREDAKANNFSATLLHVTIPIHSQAVTFNGGGKYRKNDGKGNGLGVGNIGEPAPTLTVAERHMVAHQTFIVDRAAFNQGTNAQYEPKIEEADTIPTLVSRGPHAVMNDMAVRRLTPVECERLQGFPDGYTNIPWNKKEESPDGQRYKAMGNSMAVPVMRWIGQRIEKVEHGLL